MILSAAEVRKGNLFLLFLFFFLVLVFAQVAKFFAQTTILTRITYSRGLSLCAASLHFLACHAGTARYQFSIQTVHVA